VDVDPKTLTEREQYKLMTGSIVPRPIALVTTMGPHGVNAAPFSLFNMVGTDPPMLAFSIGDQSDGRGKDTLTNIRALSEFVVHICSEEIAAAMNVCATDFPASVSEVQQAGLTTLASLKVRPPRLAEAPVQLECQTLHIVPLGKRHNLVIGEVVMFHFAHGIVDERYNVSLSALRPIGRLSGSRYARIGDTFSLDRQFIGEKPKQLAS
jgi:flavin reductase (DIM6/NTAB) family NADH-FMN oxidoreductase RutF